jgi:hypothetical protein
VAGSKVPKAPREPEERSTLAMMLLVLQQALVSTQDAKVVVLSLRSCWCLPSSSTTRAGGRGATPRPPGDPGPSGTGIALRRAMMEDICSGLQGGLLKEAPSLPTSRWVAVGPPSSKGLLWLT